MEEVTDSSSVGSTIFRRKAFGSRRLQKSFRVARNYGKGRCVCTTVRFLRPTVGCLAALLLPPLARPASPAPLAEPELLQSRLRLAPTPDQTRTWPQWPAIWLVPQALARDPNGQLSALGFDRDLIDELTRRIVTVPAPPGAATPATAQITPDLALLHRFTPAELGRWHRLLSTHAANLPSRWPLTVREDMLQLIEQRPAGAELAAQVRRIAVPSEEPTRWHLHDPWVLNPVLHATPERDALLTLLLTAHPVWPKFQPSGNDPELVRAEAAYWQSQGRFRAIEPILQALGAVTDRDRIDLVHLLPRMPRALLNSFPLRLDRSPDPTGDNMTAALSFFGGAPSLGASPDFAAWLHEQCDPVAGPRSLGDIILFEDPARHRWPFAAVYVADGLVFGRRPTLCGPWGLWRLDEMAELNPRLGREPPRVFRPRPDDPAELEGFVPLPPPPPWLRPTALQDLPAGPWGQLVTYEIFLTPSATLLAALPEPSADPAWPFRRFDEATREALLRVRALTSEQRSALHRSFAAATPAGENMHLVRPPLELVLSLPPEWRSLAYRFLDSSGGAARYFQEIRVIHPLRRDDLPPAVADRLLNLVYPRNGRFAVGDYGLIYHLTDDVAERVALLQTLARTPARIVLLERPAPAEVPALAAYWETGGRKDLSLLLDAFAEQEEVNYLDITHLLPSLPREYMNLFVVPLENRPMPSCYWTALNFSEPSPDPRFLVVPGTPGDEVAIVETELRQRYRSIERPERPGDVIAYYDRRNARAPSHVCSYLAADLVFTKNGFGYDAPWCITRRTEVDELYRQPDTGVVRYYRRIEGGADHSASAAAK